MSQERCLHTNVSSRPGIKLSEYAGNGTPVCIINFLRSSSTHSRMRYINELKPVQSFIDKIPVPLFYKNIEGKFSGCNKAFLEFIGVPGPSSQISESMRNEEGLNENCTNELTILQKTGALICESIIKGKNGELKYALIDKATIINSKGETCGLIGMISDITSNRLLKDALNTPTGRTVKSRDEHFQDLTNIKQLLFDENKKRRRLEKQLAHASRKLEDFIRKNAENRTAMKAILKYQENYRKEIQDGLVENVKHLVMPYILKLRQNRSSSDDLHCLNMIESKLDEIIATHVRDTESMHIAFTSEEIQIAGLIRDGKKDNDIMEIMNISIDTVKTHRKNIRRKLGIYGDKSNLRSKLLTLSSF